MSSAESTEHNQPSKGDLSKGGLLTSMEENHAGLFSLERGELQAVRHPCVRAVTHHPSTATETQTNVPGKPRSLTQLEDGL